jgi:uncharacterized protein
MTPSPWCVRTGVAITASLLGMVENHLLAVVHTQRDARIRIISARLAEPRERRRYHEENS